MRRTNNSIQRPPLMLGARLMQPVNTQVSYETYISREAPCVVSSRMSSLF